MLNAEHDPFLRSGVAGKLVGDHDGGVASAASAACAAELLGVMTETANALRRSLWIARRFSGTDGGSFPTFRGK